MRTSLITFVTVVGIAFTASAAQAQTSTTKKPGFELIVPGGQAGQVGDGEKTVKRGNLNAIQASYGLRPDLVLTATTSWTRTRPIGLGDEAKLHLFTYDLGAEWRMPRSASEGRLNIKPFAGVGVGARTLNYRHIDVATATDAAAYVSAGAEIRVAWVRLRLEARDYVVAPSFARLSFSKERHDVAVLAGVRLVLR